jgi:hypothetical protein
VSDFERLGDVAAAYLARTWHPCWPGGAERSTGSGGLTRPESRRACSVSTTTAAPISDPQRALSPVCEPFQIPAPPYSRPRCVRQPDHRLRGFVPNLQVALRSPGI